MACLWHDTFESIPAQIRHNQADVLTTLEVTAPLRLPLGVIYYGMPTRNSNITYKPIAMPSVTLRLYDPSTLLATHALGHYKINRRSG